MLWDGADSVTLHFSSLKSEPDNLLRVFSLLDCKDLASAELVCHEWKDFIMKEVWSKKLLMKKSTNKSWNYAMKQFGDISSINVELFGNHSTEDAIIPRKQQREEDKHTATITVEGYAHSNEGIKLAAKCAETLPGTSLMHNGQAEALRFRPQLGLSPNTPTKSPSQGLRGPVPDPDGHFLPHGNFSPQQDALQDSYSRQYGGGKCGDNFRLQLRRERLPSPGSHSH